LIELLKAQVQSDGIEPSAPINSIKRFLGRFLII